MDADPVELRVLGCLIEKQRTTPDAYPLTLNAVRAAANQSTNRDPVLALTEDEVRDALQRLNHRRWTRLASGARAAKYRHLLDDALGVDGRELAILAVLMLRGPQTAGELNTRVARLHDFGGLGEVEDTLAALAQRELAERLARRSGEREERWSQRLGGIDTAAGAEPAAPGPHDVADALAPVPAPASLSSPDEERLRAIERDLAELRAAVIELRAALGA